MRKLTTLAFVVLGLVALKPARAQQSASTDDDHIVLARKAAESGNTALQNLLQSFTPIALGAQYYPGNGDQPIYVSGDIKTRIIWLQPEEAKKTLGITFWKVRLWNGDHVPLLLERIPELLRRKEALIAAGVSEAPDPTTEQIKADAQAENAYPPKLQLQKDTSVYDLTEDVQAGKPKAALEAGSTVSFLKMAGGLCFVQYQSNQYGWIEAPNSDCGLSSFSAASPPQTIAAVTPQPQTTAAPSSPGEPKTRPKEESGADWDSALQWADHNLWLLSAVLNGLFIIDLLRTAIRYRTRSAPVLDPRVRRGYGVIEYGVPHCHFEVTNTKQGKGFTVTLKDSSSSAIIGVVYLMFFGIPVFAVWHYFAGTITNTFLVALTITSALTYLCWKRALRLAHIEVTSDIITIAGVPLERDHFGQFHVDNNKFLGYEYGGRNYALGKEWKPHQAMEIASALNARLMFEPAEPAPRPATKATPPKQPSPDDLRRTRPTDF